MPQKRLKSYSANMDWKPYEEDIQDLLQAFSGIEGTQLYQMKELWRARSFSFIHEACPKDLTPAYYMQGLYTIALGSFSKESLSWKVGGLYVLYLLYETQQNEPCVKIYLSQKDMESLLDLIRELKKYGVSTALRVVHRMLNMKMFLYGSVNADHNRVYAMVEKLSKQVKKRVKLASKKLLVNAPVEEHLHGKLEDDLALDEIGQVVEDYSQERLMISSGANGDLIELRGQLDAYDLRIHEELKNDFKDWDTFRQAVIMQLTESHQRDLNSCREEDSMDDEDRHQSIQASSRDYSQLNEDEYEVDLFENYNMEEDGLDYDDDNLAGFSEQIEDALADEY